MFRFCLFRAVCLAFALPALAVAAEPAGPPARAIDFLPPEWTALSIHWKPTWDETLAANKEQDWQAQLAKNKSLAAAAGQIVGLRRIELLKAMIDRFPNERAKQADAYRAIANTYQQIGLNYWRSYYAWKLVRTFPERKDLYPEAYSQMMAWPWGGGYYYPDSQDWRFAIHGALDLIDRGAIPAGNPVVAQACASLQELEVSEDNYAGLRSALKRIEKLAAAAPALHNISMNLLLPYGHYVEGAHFAELAGNGSEFNMLTNMPVGIAEGLPRSIELETRWERIGRGGDVAQRQDPLRPDEVQSVLDLAADTGACLRKSDAHYVSCWTMIDRALSALGPERLAELREAEQQAARDAIASVRSSASDDSLMRAFRRRPWAPGLQELLVEAGEQAVRQGHAEWAIRAFRDALDHSGNPQLRREAQVGLWLALAQEPGNRKALEAAMATVGDDVRLPWRGGEVPAGRLKRQWLALATAEEIKPVRLSQLKHRRIELPQNWPPRNWEGPTTDLGMHAPWPVSQIQAHGTALFVSGPDRVARFDAANIAPVWDRASLDRSALPPPWDLAAAARLEADMWHWEFNRRPVIVRDARRAALDATQRTFYVLESCPTGTALTALDARTGRRKWSSEGRAEWKDLAPISHPALADDRVYVLAAANPGINNGQGPGHEAGPVPLHLLALDGTDGRILWDRPLGWQAYTLFDLARGSCAVTIDQGAVYCSTNMGLVARCDIRDGLLEWVRAYPSAIHQRGPLSMNFSREGSSPLVVGNTLLVAPTDHTGVLAFRCDSGEPLWETILVPSDRLVGVSGKLLVTINDHSLAGIDLATGEPRWFRNFPESTGSQAALIGGDVVLISGGKLQRIAASGGQTIEERPLEAALNLEYAMLPDATVIEIEAPSLAPQGRGENRAASLQSPLKLPLQSPLKLPLKEVWNLPCEKPALLFQEDSGATPDSFCVLSDRRLAMIRTRPDWETTWQRLLDHRPQAVRFDGKQVFLGTQQTLWALDALSGARRWSLELPFMPYALGGDERLLFATTFPDWWPYVGAIEPATGKLAWARSLSENVRFNGGIRGAALRRGADGSSAVGLVINTLHGDVGWRLSEVLLDAGNGHIRDVKRFIPDNMNWWGIYLGYDKNSIRYFAQEGPNFRLYALPPGGASPAAAWSWKIDPNLWGRNPRLVDISRQPSGAYAKGPDVLYFFAARAEKEIAFQIPKEPQNSQNLILGFREAADKLWVVSGSGFSMPARRRHAAPSHDMKQSRVYVDVFERATGRHLERQELGGILCCERNVDGFDTQVRIFENAIVVADLDGVHVFVRSDSAR